MFENLRQWFRSWPAPCGRLFGLLNIACKMSMNIDTPVELTQVPQGEQAAVQSKVVGHVMADMLKKRELLPAASSFASSLLQHSQIKDTRGQYNYV